MEGKGTVGQGRESRKEGTEQLRGPGIWCFSQASDWWWQWLQAACVWDYWGASTGLMNSIPLEARSTNYKFRIGGTWRRSR